MYCTSKIYPLGIENETIKKLKTRIGYKDKYSDLISLQNKIGDWLNQQLILVDWVAIMYLPLVVYNHKQGLQLFPT